MADLTNERFGAAGQKVLIPAVLEKIKNFMKEKNLDDDSMMDLETLPLIKSVNEFLCRAKLRSDAMIIALFKNLEITLEDLGSKSASSASPSSDTYASSSSTSASPSHAQYNLKDSSQPEYEVANLINEILDKNEDSPKIFVINLPEADTARVFCADVIDKIFKKRKNSFTLNPKVVFVFDEAQEFIPFEKRKEDGTEYSSRAVERLLRHGRKYYLHGWISTQRIAHLKTNALQHLHSYFVSIMLGHMIDN